MGNFAFVSSLYSQKSKNICFKYMLLLGSGSVLVVICYRMNTYITTASEGKLLGMTTIHIDSLVLFFNVCPPLFLTAVGAKDTVCGRVRRCKLPVKKGTTLRQIRKVCTSKQARRFVWLIFINGNAGHRSKTSFSKAVLCQFWVSFWT